MPTNPPIGTDYDHIDAMNLGGSTGVVRHMLKDAQAREDVSELKSALSVDGSLAIIFVDRPSYFGASRVESKILKYNSDLTFRAKDQSGTPGFYVKYFKEDGTSDGKTGWVKTLTIPKGRRFQIVVSLTPTVNTAASIPDILAAFEYSFDFGVSDISDLKDVLMDDGTLDVFPFLNTITGQTTFNGVTITPNSDRSFSVVSAEGGATGLANFIFFYKEVGSYYKAGETLSFHIEDTGGIPVQLWYLPSGGSLTWVKSVNCDTDFSYTLPVNTEKLYFRLSISSGKVITNGRIKCNIYNSSVADMKTHMTWLPSGTNFNNLMNAGVYAFLSDASPAHMNNPVPSTETGWLFVFPAGTAVLQIAYNFDGSNMWIRRYFNSWGSWIKQTTNDAMNLVSKGGVASNTDLNSITTSGVYLLNDSNTYSNMPFVGSGMLIVFDSGTVLYQMAMPWNPVYICTRRKHKSQDSWSDWYKAGGSQEVTVTPSITTDTHNWLEPTGDSTDVSASIMAMLETGVCHLAPGDFYVDPNKIEMPDNSTLMGCGQSTRIVLRGSSDGYCIKMGWYNTVKDLCIEGHGSKQTSAPGANGRHGILWQGDYTENKNSYAHTVPRLGLVDNVIISGFTGGCITCYDTGYAIFTSLRVSNCILQTSTVGINIAYWSEAHNFTNVKCRANTFGCINNGGNNVFVNCDFSENTNTAFLIDNEIEGQNPNTAHGSAIGCIFNHTNNNKGIGIHIKGTHNGFVFDGCQIFYSKIILSGAYGIEVVNTNFGNSNCDISITGGGLILFANNLHGGTPTITIASNQNVHFSNCYVRDTGAVVSN